MKMTTTICLDFYPMGIPIGRFIYSYIVVSHLVLVHDVISFSIPHMETLFMHSSFQS